MTTIKRINAWSLAKLSATCYLIMGLIVGLIQWVFMAILGTVFGSLGPNTLPMAKTGLFGVGLIASMGFMAIVFVAIFMAVTGFVFGLIGAWIYNLIARWVGGVKIELISEPGIN